MTVLRLWTHDPNPITMRRPIDARADYWAYCLWCDTLNGPHHTEDQAQHVDAEHQSKPCPPDTRRARQYNFTTNEDWVIVHRTAREAARILNRTIDSIYWRRKRLRAAGIAVSDERSAALASTERRPWTPAEDKIATSHTIPEAVKLLEGRTYSAVQNRRSNLRKRGERTAA